MGGDFGPSVVLPGLEHVLERRSDVTFLLFGREEAIRPVLDGLERLKKNAEGLIDTNKELVASDKKDGKDEG